MLLEVVAIKGGSRISETGKIEEIRACGPKESLRQTESATRRKTPLSTVQLTNMERLLLMAAAVQGLGPQTDLSYANTALVVLQALKWSGLDSAEVREQWHQLARHPALDEVYEPLIHMTHQQVRDGGIRAAERPGPALFEGGGNWGSPGDPERRPCHPHFNSCRLTALGEQIALALLAEHPEFDAR